MPSLSPSLRKPKRPICLDIESRARERTGPKTAILKFYPFIFNEMTNMYQIPVDPHQEITRIGDIETESETQTRFDTDRL